MTDYRAILYRHEWEDLLRDKTPEEELKSPYFADVLLGRIFETDARKLGRLYPRWTRGQRTLYAINAFIGEVCNGGVSQFLFNPCSVLRYEVLDALGSVGAHEVAERYARVLHHYESSEPELDQLRLEAMKSAPPWEGYLQFIRRFEAGMTTSADEDFETWFYGEQKDELERRLRRHVHAAPDDFVVFCDGDPKLETQRVIEELKHFGERALHFSESKFWNPFCGDLFPPDVLVAEQENPRQRADMALDVLKQKARVLQSLAKGRFKAVLSHESGKKVVNVWVKVGLFGTESMRFERRGCAWTLAEWQ